MNRRHSMRRALRIFSLCTVLAIFGTPEAKAEGDVELSKEQAQKITEAIIGNNLNYIKKLIKKDPRAARIPYPDETLLDKAVIFQQPDIVLFLLEQGADPNCQEAGIGAKTPMDRVAFSGNIEIATILLNHGAAIDNNRVSGKEREVTPYMKAVSKNNVAMSRFLITHGADGSYVTEYGEDALLAAVWFSHFTIKADVDFLRFLVGNGANLNGVVNKDFEEEATPLLCVGKAKRRDLYDYLVSAGADPNYKDYYGHTAMDYLEGKATPQS